MSTTTTDTSSIDEKKATKTYRKYGFMELSHDEHEHYKFLKRKLK
jgi:tRNA G26 N,N-dimethylase Trm1